MVQDTLDAGTPDNVRQMQAARDTIYRRFGPGYRHDYAAAWQVLDVDLSGLPCGRKAALATKGSFAHSRRRRRRGRPLGRVLATRYGEVATRYGEVATRYGEVVVDRLSSGTTLLAAALPALVEAAEQTRELDAPKRARTILRVDGGGGSVGDMGHQLGS